MCQKLFTVLFIRLTCHLDAVIVKMKKYYNPNYDKEVGNKNLHLHGPKKFYGLIIVSCRFNKKEMFKDLFKR